MSSDYRWPFRGLCLHAPKQEDIGVFKTMVAEALAPRGCNVVVMIVRYRYEFRSHPEVREPGALTLEQVRDLADHCRKFGIRLIPKMNLLGHQSSAGAVNVQGLLRSHPEFEETPAGREVKYCRTLCPRHPGVGPLLRDLIDEMIEAFAADAFHVGLDEVFEIGLCERCRGTSTAELYAEWVNFLHDHIVGRRGVEMMMWGDRLLDAAATGCNRWDASDNGTAPAIDAIPKDILVCDWHYIERDDYPSVRILPARGFRTVVCPYNEAAAAQSLMACAEAHRTPRLLGFMQTNWGDTGLFARLLLEKKCRDGQANAARATDSFKLVARLSR